jgi:hypothetical protein
MLLQVAMQQTSGTDVTSEDDLELKGLAKSFEKAETPGDQLRPSSRERKGKKLARNFAGRKQE